MPFDGVLAVFDRSGRRLALSDGQELQIWDLDRHASKTARLRTPARYLRFEQDVVLVGLEAGFAVYDAHSAATLWDAAPTMGADYGSELLLSPDGRTVVTWDRNGALTAWAVPRMGEGARRILERGDLRVQAAAFDRRTGALAVCSSTANALQRFDLGGTADVQAVQLDAPCSAVASDARHGRLAVATRGAVFLVDGARATRLRVMASAGSLHFNADGGLLAVVDGAVPMVHVLEVPTGTLRARAPTVQYRFPVQEHVAFSPDSTRLQMPGWSYTLRSGELLADACRKLRKGARDEQAASELGDDAAAARGCLAAATVP